MATKTRSKAKPAAKSQARHKDQTQVSISISKALLKDIDQCAKADNRTRSNWVVLKLNAAVAEEE